MDRKCFWCDKPSIEEMCDECYRAHIASIKPERRPALEQLTRVLRRELRAEPETFATVWGTVEGVL